MGFIYMEVLIYELFTICSLSFWPSFDGAGSRGHVGINNTREIRGHIGAKMDFLQLELVQVYRSLLKPMANNHHAIKSEFSMVLLC